MSAAVFVANHPLGCVLKDHTFGESRCSQGTEYHRATATVRKPKETIQTIPPSDQPSANAGYTLDHVPHWGFAFPKNAIEFSESVALYAPVAKEYFDKYGHKNHYGD